MRSKGRTGKVSVCRMDIELEMMGYRPVVGVMCIRMGEKRGEGGR